MPIDLSLGGEPVIQFMARRESSLCRAPFGRLLDELLSMHGHEREGLLRCPTQVEFKTVSLHGKSPQTNGYPSGPCSRLSPAVPIRICNDLARWKSGAPCNSLAGQLAPGGETLIAMLSAAEFEGSDLSRSLTLRRHEAKQTQWTHSQSNRLQESPDGDENTYCGVRIGNGVCEQGGPYA